MVPPDPIPNSEVKRRCADGSVGLPHVRVGHRQVVNVNPELKSLGFLFMDFYLWIFIIFEFDKLKCGRKLVCFYVKNI